MSTALGGLTPVTSATTSMAVLVGKPSTADATKKDFGLVASTYFASAASVAAESAARGSAIAAAVATEVTARNAAIDAAVSGLSGGGGGSGGPTNAVIDATVTASGTLDATKLFVLFNGSVPLSMSLPNGTTSRPLMVLKNISSYSVAISGQIDGATGTLTIGPMTAFVIAWAVARTSWLIVGQYDLGSLVSELSAATLSGTTQFPVFDPDNTGKKTTGSALANYLSGAITVGNATNVTGVVAVANGGTGQTTAALGRVAINRGAATLTPGSSIATDASQNNVFKVTLSANGTLANPTNLVDGASYVWKIAQDATGSRTLAYGSAFKWVGGTPPVLSTIGNSVDILSAISDGTNVYGVLSKGFT